jgi:putative sigma-54 modulation protein
MRTNLKTTGIELTEALQDYVDEKVGQIEKFLDPSDESAFCDVEIGMSTKHHQSGEIFRAEMNVHIAGADFVVESEKEDLYVAINDAKEQMAQSIKEHRSKDRVQSRKGAGVIKNLLKGLGK